MAAPCFPLRLEHDAGHRLDELVARLVAVFVVHALESVDIAEDEGTRDALRQFVEVVVEAAAVHEPRHLVAQAHVFELAHGVAVADHDGDEAAQRHHEIARHLEEILLRINDLQMADDFVRELERHGDKAADIGQIALDP